MVSFCFLRGENLHKTSDPCTICIHMMLPRCTETQLLACHKPVLVIQTLRCLMLCACVHRCVHMCMCLCVCVWGFVVVKFCGTVSNVCEPLKFTVTLWNFSNQAYMPCLALSFVISTKDIVRQDRANALRTGTESYCSSALVPLLTAENNCM